MKRYTFVLLAVSVLMAIAVTAIGAADRHRSKYRRYQAKAGPPGMVAEVQLKLAPPSLPPKLPPDEFPAVPSLQVEPLSGVKGDVLRLHSRAAALITQANPTPAHRTQHFGWISTNKKWRLLGWGGFVRDVEPVPGGYRVTIRVSPLMTEDYRSATSADYTLETYLISNGHVHFIQGIDPPDASPGVAVAD